jgi:hypothetical protein
MQRTLPPLLAAAGLATIIVAWHSDRQVITATGNDNPSVAEIDSDGDFLPDVCEWVTLTNSSKPDTDGDGQSDFLEVLTGTNPRRPDAQAPQDHQLRVIVTEPPPGSTDPLTWLHVFHRVMPTGAPSAAAQQIQAFDLWLESPQWPGFRLPLNSFAASGTYYRQRVTQQHGVWIQLSVPLVPSPLLRSLMPCTIWADTVVSGKQLIHGVKLLPVPSGAATLVPFGDDRFVIQTLSPVASTSNTMFTETNRVCVLTLDETSVGPAGVTYIVTAADCEDANDLECELSCSASVGWTITIPGGTQALSGN